jgi:endonuclease/exonuclease/phosphatase family metal-dependent hydrolase
MRFASWNLGYCGKEGARRRVEFLHNSDWDVVALQEVSRHAWVVFTESSLAESSACTLEMFEPPPPRKRQHGVALLSRNGFQLSPPKLLAGFPKAERALIARTTVGDTPVTVISWHAPNAAGEGVMTKMQGYRGIVGWLGTLSGPIILGFDGNHWNRSVDLEPEHVPASDDPWLLENLFFGSNRVHRLRDAFLDHLRVRPAEHEEIKKRRPHGPLAVSYIRGSKANPTEDRFDYVFITDELSVTECSYDYQGAKAAGSDHGIVTADLHIRP